VSRRQLLLICATLVALQSPLSAQVVQGHLRDVDGRALAGAHVVLLDDAGTSVDATLTDAHGAFTLTCAELGGHTLRAEPVGYTVAEATVPLGLGTAEVELVGGDLGLVLPESAFTPDRRCRVPEGADAKVSALWTEVRKALLATRLAEEAGIRGQERRTWSRQLDPEDLTVLHEDGKPVTGFQPGPPFRSPPPEELAQFGFIQGGAGEGYSFFAPDTRTLLSSIFTDSHCLGFDPAGPDEGWVGLTFRPRFEGGMDVAGTLWIDASTLGPQRLEFQYTNLPWPLKTDKVGGLVEFHRLDDGPWVVQRWWVRSPRVGVRVTRMTQWAEPQQRFELSAVVEDGGEVVRVRFRDGRVERLAAAGA